MPRRTWLRSLLAIALLASSMGVATPARALGSTVSPDIGPPGTRFSFVAEGFAPNEIVRVQVKTPDGRAVRFSDRAGFDIPVFADGAGKATWSFVVPDDTPDGLYVAEATNISGQIRRRIAFIVQAGAIPAELAAPEPGSNVFVRPEIGPPGTLYAFVATGFLPLERVGIWLHAPDGSISDLAADIGGRSDHVANREGVLQWVVGSRASTPDGRYVAVAAGTSSGLTRVVAFQVQQGAVQAQPVATPNTSVFPVSGPPGTSFAFTATGLLPLEGVGIWIHRPDGQIITVTADGQAVRADQSGTARWSVTANQNLADGVYAMVAQGVTSTQVRVVRFEIRR
jgi:hypothetical protein